MSKVISLTELLVDELKDLYSAETQLTKAIPKMAKAASNPTLRQGFLDHLEQTKGHVDRLVRALKYLGASPGGKVCKAMKGLIEEGAEAIGQKGPDSLRDANLIGAAQRVEHYEMAAYGTSRAFAEALGESEIVNLLSETYREEVATDKKLTTVSKQVNMDALEASGDRSETA
jgi:ferritin-like metal-binding protein YciE